MAVMGMLLLSALHVLWSTIDRQINHCCSVVLQHTTILNVVLLLLPFAAVAGLSAI
jgi:hypothetical protein